MSVIITSAEAALSRGAEARLWGLHFKMFDALLKRLREAAANEARERPGVPPPEKLLVS